MAKTFAQQKERFGKLTRNETASNETYGGELINDFTREFLYSYSFYTNESQGTDTTVAGQAPYDFSGFASDVGRVIAVQVQNGSDNNPLIEIKSWDQWQQLTENEYQSNFADMFFVYQESILLYPTPSTSGQDITLTFQKEPGAQSADSDESPMPQGFEMLPVYMAAADYMLGEEGKETLADRYEARAEKMNKKMKGKYGGRSENPRLDTPFNSITNPNDFPNSLS